MGIILSILSKSFALFFVIFFFEVNHSNHPSTRPFDPPAHGLTSTATMPTMAWLPCMQGGDGVNMLATNSVTHGANNKGKHYAMG